MRRLLDVVERFSRLRVLVVGDAILDTYLHGDAVRICREGPVPVVELAGRADRPGGAANAAANTSGLGASTTFVSLVGADREGELLEGALAADGVDCSRLIRSPSHPTVAKSRVLAASQLLVRFDQPAPPSPGPTAEEAIVALLRDLFPQADAVLVADYNGGVLTPRVVETIAALQRCSPRIVVVDSPRPRAFRSIRPTAVKPNRDEAVGLLGPSAMPHTGADPAEAIATTGDRILAATGAQVAAVTLDSHGAIVLERGRPAYRTYGRPSDGSRAIGAGDTFAAALALALAAGADTASAAEIASAAGAVVVGKEGTAVCSGVELRDALFSREERLTTLARLLPALAGRRERGERVVLTNGCFDILHRGHVSLLSEAKGLGDVLVVGVNTDASVRRLKGDGRPITPLEDRAALLAALSPVDFVVPFGEDTARPLVEAVRPDVYVKGADHERASLPEAVLVEQLGGEVRILPYFEERSTTGVIDRVRELVAREA
ncbi:MAG: D-glycero-beta-D-manno-heptose 1-phosphate adenylyltransferase [Actinomycetota bacterium]|nr:D-glycero-beta-D-manno-heptose 1-phosphate adenylyltransferase [Actinomycetota bacterium]